MSLLRWLRARGRTPLRRHVAAAAVATLAFATLAFASHLHEIDASKGRATDQICALCLHFERLGTTPEVVLVAGGLPAPAAAPPYVAPARAARDVARAYLSRAPPA